MAGREVVRSPADLGAALLAQYPVSLDVFEGPLDLLLFLVRREHISPYDVPVSRVVEQFVGYLRAMRELDLDVGGEFLAMAATLLSIKSRLLLSRPGTEEHEEALAEAGELARRLEEYERARRAAEILLNLELRREGIYPREPADGDGRGRLLVASLPELVEAARRVLSRAEARVVGGRRMSLEEAVERVLSILSKRPRVSLRRLFPRRPTREEVVAIFLAILHLLFERRIWAYQERPFGPIYLSLRRGGSKVARRA